MINKITDYIKGTRAEMKHVNWPSKKQTVNFTLLVIAVSLGIAAFLGAFDAIFGYVLKIFVL